MSLSTSSSTGEIVAVRQKQGSVHCFLIVKSPEGRPIGVADEVNTAQGNRVYSRLTIRFRDGSLDDETAIFTQSQSFRLVSDRHVQKGPSFPKALDLTIDVLRGEIRWREMKSGKEEATTEHMDLPPDLANGLIPVLVENFPKSTDRMEVSYLGGNSKPRLIKVIIKPDGAHEIFRIGDVSRKATRFNLHADIPGLVGVMAPILGREPSDALLWVIDGQVPTVLKMEGALYLGGPIRTMELASPVWPRK